MGIDRIRLTGLIKVSALVVYIIYFLISNIGYLKILESFVGVTPDTELKRNLLSSKCLLLTGGSNVIMGLSAEAMSSELCKVINLGVSSEAGGFNKYLEWLSRDILADRVVYSSAAIWSSSSIFRNEDPEIIFPSNSLFTIFKSALSTEKNGTVKKFNQFGDQLEYQCSKNFLPFSIKKNDYVSSSNLVNQEVYERIAILKKITNSDEIFLRVPPVYVKTKEEAQIYKELMNERVLALRRLGVKIVGTTIVSTDSSLFCDSFHPNAKGREVFSKEIVFP